MSNLKQILRDKLREIDCGYYDAFIVLSDKKYRIGRMSYDEYFVEPYKKGRTERDKFDDNTLWEKSDGLEILQLLLDNGKIEL